MHAVLLFVRVEMIDCLCTFRSFLFPRCCCCTIKSKCHLVITVIYSGVYGLLKRLSTAVVTGQMWN